MTDRSGASGDSSGVVLEGVSKHFGDVEAVRRVDLEVRRGEFFSLLGPSGCGKTTLLRLIAGFEDPDGGRISIAGRDVTGTRPQQRPTAMVFQSYALFPTMTVGENVGYGLRVRGMARKERAARVEELLSRVDLPGLAQRPVALLSGGQQQRVALARALAVEPDVLLFDEPLSNLDVALRDQTRRELKRLQHRLGTTSVYVTHDQQEALALSDRIGVMRSGSLIQIDTPRGLYAAPATGFVAQFLGWNVVTNADLAEQLCGVRPGPHEALGIRPEDLLLVTDGGIQGQIDSVQFLGMQQEWMISTDNGTLRAWVPPDVDGSGIVRLAPRRHRLLENDLTPSGNEP